LAWALTYDGPALSAALDAGEPKSDARAAWITHAVMDVMRLSCDGSVYSRSNSGLCKVAFEVGGCCQRVHGLGVAVARIWQSDGGRILGRSLIVYVHGEAT